MQSARELVGISLKQFAGCRQPMLQVLD